MLSPSEIGYGLESYARVWLEERLRVTVELAAAAAEQPTPGKVHDVRVSCRRLREAIEFFRDVPGLPPLSGVDRAARRMARSVRRLRAIDVSRKTAARLPLADTDREARIARDKLVRKLDEKRRGVAAKRAKRIARRAEALDAAVRVHLPLRGETHVVEPEADAEAHLRMFIENRLAERRIRVEMLCREALGGAGDEGRRAPTVPDPESLHAVRVAIKHWRYANEIGRALAPRILYRPMVSKLRDLQDTGGANQDMVDLVDLAERELDRGHRSQPGKGALLTILRAQSRRTARQFAATLRTHFGPPRRVGRRSAAPAQKM